MKVKWLGHASFLITASDGTRILTDPFGDYPGLRYGPIRESAEVILVSHDHGDHVGAKVGGNPRQISGPGDHEAGGVECKGVGTYHDTSKGKERGKNTVFCFSVDGIRLCHLGDLGHELSDSEIANIGPVDVLMIPVGGFFTIDADTATAICARIRPRVAIPMHYKTSKCDFPISGVEDFLKGKENVRELDTSEVELNPNQLPDPTEIVVLAHAL
jgi:L-ascorbate metabolism protein UlaG (beta-lactamase superfamily)